MVYRAFTPSVLFAQGDPGEVTSILDEFSTEPKVSLHVRPEMLAVLKTRYDIVELRHMWRMVLERDAYRSGSTPEVVRLSSAHLRAVKQLYDDGASSGESPDFFFPSMLDAGVFYGLWEADELVAVAGTHLVVSSEDVAAVGNVYTRRDRRGRGLAARVTSAVVDELLRLKIRTIVLNVNQSNTSAIHVYEWLHAALRLLRGCCCLACLEEMPYLGIVTAEQRAKLSRVVWIDSGRMSGAPCFAGTRAPVQMLLDHLKHGDTIDDFLEGAPSVTRD